ncbi:LysR family transcriptional regulator [Tropicibacter sp. R15_0]|uniref:LysR family transcriptional regulator n=1 Tax=Tropicibacter sp. R15_0 TaxID=2821101 RepID=UPI001ADCDE31|nr:LysR family transcriptional regulator [Tropicibacter sp. R15_0]MBO9465653.1 LysR family transcriptional regulator [Tropicibacter sp. R15_0]
MKLTAIDAIDVLMHLEKLDLNLLVAIEALMRRRSVTAAAEELNLTQSAMSGALKRARQHFDDDLFFYDGQSMVSTAFGRVLEQQIPDVVTQLRALARMRATSNLATLNRCFTIIASDYISAVFLSALSKHLEKIAPHVSLSVMPYTREAIRQFKSGVVDFLIGPDFSIEEGYNAEPLLDDHFKCVLWKENEALKTGFAAEDFFASSMIVTNFFLQNGKSHFERWLEGQTENVRVAASLPSFVVLPSYIAGTQNVATIHERLVAHMSWSDELVFVDPPVDIPVLREYLVTNKKHPFDKDAQLLAKEMHQLAEQL